MTREKEVHTGKLKWILEVFLSRETQFQKEIAQWLHIDSRTVKANFYMKGGGTKGTNCWDQRGQSGPCRAADIKKERPEGGASRRSVPGLVNKSENNRRVMITRFARKCKPRTSAGEGVTLR